MIPTVSGYARPELLASVDWLADNFGRPELRVLDARWRPDGTGRAVHAHGHIPGAAYVDWLTDLTAPDGDDATPHLLLAGPEQVARALGRAGIADGMTVVVYDDTASLFAARVWWSLRAYGLESCRILDGGYGAWASESRALSHAVMLPPAATFSPRAQPRARLTTSDVRALLGSPEVALLDARSPTEFRGFEGGGRRLGRIPGSVNVPAARLTRPGDQGFRDGDELREILKAANVTRTRRIVCYDETGVGAAKLAFVLTLLGHEEVAVYDGGWSEWGDRLDLPVER